MFESIPAFLSSLRQTSPAIFTGIAIASGIIILAPADFAAMLGVDIFRQENRSTLGFAFIGSISIVLVYAVWGALRYAKKVHKRRKAVRVREQYLHDLTADEKAYLIPYVVEGENTQYLQMEDGVVGGLVNKGIIYRASNIGSLVTGWAYNIQPWAKEYLTICPSLLEGASSNPSGPPHW